MDTDAHRSKTKNLFVSISVNPWLESAFSAACYGPALEALGRTGSQYSLASFRYDLSKLRAKGLVEKIPRSGRYRLAGKGYSICVAFLKLFEKIYAPLTAGLLAPFRGDRLMLEAERCYWIDCISASAMIWMRSCESSASMSPGEPPQREQNSRCGPYNGN